MTIQLPFDFRFAWESAKLAFPFVRRGITPEGRNSTRHSSTARTLTYFLCS